MPTQKKAQTVNKKNNPGGKKKSGNVVVRSIFGVQKKKKFSPPFAYSIASLLILAGLLFVSFFIFFLRNQADEQKIKTITAVPGVCEGWQNAQGAREINVTGSGTAEEFGIGNSAYLKFQKSAQDEMQDFGIAVGEPISITCSEFTYPNAQQFTIRGAFLEISLSAEVSEATDNILTLEYSLDDQTWTTLSSEVLTGSMANKDRDGYVRYQLPYELIESHLADFSFRYSFRRFTSEGETRIFLDGGKLILDAQKKLAIPDLPTDVVRMAKLEYNPGEQPTFAIHVDTKRGVPLLQKKNERTVTAIELVDPSLATAEGAVQLTSDTAGEWEEYTIDPKQFSKPGKYVLRVHINEAGEEKTYTQEFSWGVLAINTDKSSYTPGERAEFSIGVLDEVGDIVCDADVELQITDPVGIVTKLTTDDGTIAVTDSCYQKKEFERPDYLASYEVEHAGMYQYQVSASHHNGVFNFTDTFLSGAQEEFSVQRHGPTRVFPKVWQPMELRITAYRDFSGTIKDVLPDGFQIEPSLTYRVEQVSVDGRVVQEVIWDTTLSEGQSATFAYKFKPPEVSPAFYVIGQARIGAWQENRVWQIAVDPTYMYLLANTGSGVASGWVLDTGSDGNFLRAASTAGGTGGNATHTNTFTETVGSGTPTTVTNCSFRCANASGGTHTHTSTGSSIGSANNDPAHHTFYLWKYNTTDATPPDIPDNVFILFDNVSGQPTSPWTRFSAADNRLIQIDNSHTTGGSDTHNHTITWGSLNAASGTGLASAGLNNVFSSSTHTHTAPSTPSTTDSTTSLPEYSTFEIYEQTSAMSQSLPTGMIALFDGTPPAGWTVISDSSPSQNKFLRGSATAGSTGGDATSAHASAVGTTGIQSATFTSVESGSGSMATEDHTHNITLSSFNSADITPPYENYILAEYVGATGIDISGNILGTDESTFIGNPPCDGSTANVGLRVNGGSESTTSCNSSTGAYSFTGVSASAGDTITIYLTGETEKANLVLIVGSSNITDADVYESRVIVRDDDNGTLSILDMLDYDNDENATDMIFDADDLATDTLSVESGYELHIWTGDTFDPNGTVTTSGTGGDLHIEGTAYLDTATNTIGGNVTIDSGATLHIQQSTTVTGSTNGGISTAGTLNITGGTNTIGDGSDEDISVTAGTTTISGGTTSLKDDFLQSGGSVSITSTVNINGSSGSYLSITDGTYTINTGGDVTIGGRMQVIGASAVANLTNGTTTAASYFYFNQGTVNLAGGNHYTGTDSYMFLANAAGTTTFNMTGGHIYTKGLIASDVGTLVTTSVTGGTIHIGQIATANVYWDKNPNTHQFYNIQIDESASISTLSTEPMTLNGSLVIASGKTFTANSINIFIDNDSTGDGNWTNNGGTFTPGTGTVTMGGGQINGSGDTTFYNLTIDPSSAGTVTVDTDTGADDPTITNTFTVALGDTFAIESGRTVTASGGSDVAGTGTISGAGTLIFPSGAGGPGTNITTLSSVVRFDSSGGAVVNTTVDARTYGGAVNFYGNNSSNTITLPSGTFSFSSNLTTTQDGTGATTITANTNDPTITVAGSFTIGAGTTFQASNSGAFTLNGDMTNGGTFTSNGGTVTVSGSAQQTIAGFGSTNGFNNLIITNNSGSDPDASPSVIFSTTTDVNNTYTINTAGVKIRYADGTSFTALGINLNGSSGAGNQVYFRSSTPGTHYNFIYLEIYGQTLTYVDAQDADSSGGTTINATGTGNVNSGNNINWNFGAITVMGTVYSDVLGTSFNCNTTNLTLNVSVNGDATPDTGTCTASNGTFSISATLPSGADDHVVLYIDGVEAQSATTATLTSSQYEDVAINLYVDYVALDSESGTTQSNTLLDTFDGGNDADIDYTVTTSNLSVSSGHGLFLETNYTPGGTVTTPASSANAGTVDAGGDGDLVINTGVALAMSTDALSIGGDYLNDGTLSIGINQVTTFTGTTTGFIINHNAEVFQYVTFNGSGGGWSFSEAVTVGKNLVMTAGTLSGTVDVTCNGGAVTGNGTINLTGGTFTKAGTGNFGGDTNWTFYNLLFESTTAGDRTTTATGTGGITITSVLTTENAMVGETTYYHIVEAGSKTWYLTGSGTPFVHKGQLRGQTSTFEYSGASATNVTRANSVTTNYYNNVALKPSTASSVFTLPPGAAYINNDLTIDSGHSSASITGTANNGSITIGGDFTCIVGETNTIATGTGTWTVSGNLNLTNCSLTATSGHTFVMDGTGIYTSAGNAVHHLTLSGTVALASGTHTVAGNLTLSGTLNAGSSTVTMTGTSNSIVGGENTVYNLTIDPASTGTITVQTSDLSVSNTLTIASGDTLTVDTSRTVTMTGASTLSLSGILNGAGVLLYKSGTIVPATGTLNVDVTFNTRDVGLITSTARTYGGDVSLVCNPFSMAPQSVQFAAGTLIFSGDVSIDSDLCSSNTFDLDTNDPTTTISGDLTTINSGKLIASDTNPLTANGNWAMNGNFDDNNGEVIFAGTSQQTISGPLNYSFYDLTVTNTSGSDPDIIFAASVYVTNNFTASTAATQIQFAAGETFTFKNIDLNGQASGTRVDLTSSVPGTQWNLNVAGVRSVSYTQVRDSNACGQAPDIDASDGTNLDATNNDCWVINALSLSISDTTIGFGSPAVGASRYATGSTTGSVSEVEAHTIEASTNSETGYILTVSGPTLTSGSDTITAIGGTNTAPATGTEQFGMRLTASGGSGSVSAPYADAGFAYDAEGAPDIIASSSVASALTTYSVRYLINIATLTESGGYGADLMFVLTSQF